MNEDLKALETNQSWTLTNLPLGKKDIDYKWIYKTKFNPDGLIDIEKARLVMLGNRQKKSVGYEQTFAPVAKLIIVRSLFAIAALKEWKVCQMDVKNVFSLHGTLEKNVYMHTPPGYTSHGIPITKEQWEYASYQQVCKVQKSL